MFVVPEMRGHPGLQDPFHYGLGKLFEKAMLRLARKSAHTLGMTAEKRAHPLAFRVVNGKLRMTRTEDAA